MSHAQGQEEERNHDKRPYRSGDEGLFLLLVLLRLRLLQLDAYISTGGELYLWLMASRLWGHRLQLLSSAPGYVLRNPHLCPKNCSAVPHQARLHFHSCG